MLSSDVRHLGSFHLESTVVSPLPSLGLVFYPQSSECRVHSAGSVLYCYNILFKEFGVYSLLFVSLKVSFSWFFGAKEHLSLPFW